MKDLLVRALLFATLVSLGACGGGGGGDDVGGETPPGSEPPPVATGNCQTDFNPERIAAGENCAPVTGSLCTVPDGLLPDTLVCDGVTVSSHTVTGGALSSSYLALRSSSRPPQAIYLALHYLGARNGAFANLVRLPELAKGRDVLVLVPQAPSSVGGLIPLPPAPQLPLPIGLNLSSRWPTNSAIEPVAQFVGFLDAVVTDARSRFAAGDLPLYVSGLSNGGAMAFLYACSAADRISAVQLVAASLPLLSVEQCAPSQAIGSVIVHGTADGLSLYAGRPLVTESVPQTHAFFKNNNGCAGDDSAATIPPTANDSLSVELLYTAPCNLARRSLLVTIVGGGHNWPGEAVGPDASNAGLLGPKSTQFDATLQGYDLLRYAVGN